nr:MAG TPA: hypothetical protein [Caudoviricetes sp.]
MIGRLKMRRLQKIKARYSVALPAGGAVQWAIN